MRDIIQKEITSKILESNFSGIIDVAPRVGKSKIIIDALQHFKGNVLITVPFNLIIDSWVSEIKKWNSKGKFTFQIINQRSIPLDLSDYDLVIADEVHSLSELQISKLKSAKKILGASGSIGNKTKVKLKEQLNLDIIARYTLDEAVNDKIISDYQINIVYCDLSATKQIAVKTKKSNYFQSELNRYKSVDKYFKKSAALAFESFGTPQHAKYKRMKMAAAGFRANFLYTAPTKIELARSLINDIDRSLIFTARTAVADELGNPHHGKVKKSNFEKFINGSLDSLATVQMVQMGITIPNLKVGIFHQIQSSDETAVQKVLRMCNLEDKRKAEVFICCYRDTIDEDWVASSLKMFNSSKIKYI